MPTPAYISITGKTQGNITQGAFTADSVGNGFVEGHEDEILVQEVKHLIQLPTDPQSGQPTGQRVHRPLVFTCSVNKSVPLLYQALASGELLTKVVLKLYRTSVNGQQEHFFSTTLEDAVIVNISMAVPNAQSPMYSDFTQLIDVAMSYRKISWEHVVANTSAADDWRTPKAG